MLKKIEKPENKFAINAILPLKTFLTFGKKLYGLIENPLHNHREIFIKKSKTKNLSKRFSVRERLYVLREKSATRPECP